MAEFNLFEGINAISRELLDRIPKIKRVILVMSDDATPEDVKEINNAIDSWTSLTLTSAQPSTIDKAHLPLLSISCDGYIFDFIREKDL